MIRFGKRTKEVISIQIQADCIKYGLGNYNNDSLVVNKLLSVELDIGVYENGMPTDEHALQTALESGIRQLNTNAKDVILSLESSEILKREIQVPKVDEQDLKDLVKFEVSQYLPIEVDDYVLQHQIISVESDEDNEKLNILIVAMPKDMAKFYFDLITDLRLNPAGMDLSGSNATKLVKFGMNDILVDNTVAILDLSYSNLEIIILENGLNKLNRLINMGPQKIDQVVAEKLKIPFKQAHKLVLSYFNESVYDLIEANKAFVQLSKNESVTFDDLKIEDLNKNASRKMSAIGEIIDHLQDIYDELEKVFKYYQFKERGNKIDKILIYGDFSKIEGLRELLEERIKVKTELIQADSFSKVMLRANVSNVNCYISTIGGLISS